MRFTRGDTQGFKFQRKNINDEIITSIPTNVYFTVKDNVNNDNFIIQKTLDNGSITFSKDDNYYHFIIEPNDTNNLNYGCYVYDIEIIQNDYVKTVKKGYLELTNEVTFQSNEVENEQSISSINTNITYNDIDINMSTDCLPEKELELEPESIVISSDIIIKGEDGATFIPNVSEEGIISWSNDKDLPNPSPVNIKGPKGDQGIQGEHGIQGLPGENGQDGYTPKRGIDYWTQEDITTINNYIDDYIDNNYLSLLGGSY